MRRLLSPFLLVLLAVGAGVTAPGCASGAEATVEAASGAEDRATEAEDRALVLVSIDGFRTDYLDREDLDLSALRAVAEGVRAERLIPVFPTKTFPNHYSLVTGLHPEAHGIVGNTMRDPTMLDANGEPARFSLSNREAIIDGRWWGGEPIWVTAENQGLTAGTVFWPGSEAEIAGVRPTRWIPYDGDMPYADRVDLALSWLRAGDDLVTLYFEAVDSAGHRYGPDAPETDAAIERVDDALDRLLAGLQEHGLAETTDVVVVSDHGMVELSRDRVVVLDDAVDLETVDVDWGEPVGIWPEPGVDVDALVERVSALDHVTAYRKEDVPERLHYSDNVRIPPVVLLADDGWTVSSRDYLDRYDDRPSGGGHGWDNAFESMHGIFLATGPSFRDGLATGPIRTVDVYGVVAAALGLDPAPNAGDPSVADRVLE